MKQLVTLVDNLVRNISGRGEIDIEMVLWAEGSFC